MMNKHTCHLQQPVSQSAFSMVNVSNDAKIPDSVHRKLGQVDGVLRKGKELLCLFLKYRTRILSLMNLTSHPFN